MSQTVKDCSVSRQSAQRDSIFQKSRCDSLIRNAPPGLNFEPIEIGNLPLYNEDLEQAPPREWSQLRAGIAGTSAVLFVTPEYNRSIPGCLKNALDVGSRPENKKRLGRQACCSGQRHAVQTRWLWRQSRASADVCFFSTCRSCSNPKLTSVKRKSCSRERWLAQE